MNRRMTWRRAAVARRVLTTTLTAAALAAGGRAVAGPGLVVASATAGGTPVLVAGSFTGGDVPAAVTPDGLFVAFCGVTPASTTVGVPDTNGTPELYVRDLRTGALSLVTYNAARTAAAGGCEGTPSISDDGRFVAFSSDLQAGNYVSGVIDTNGMADAFVHDRLSGVTRLVSMSIDGTRTARGVAGGPVLSPNGRYVAFTSAAAPLVSGFVDGNGPAADLYALNLETGTTRLVTARAGSTTAGHDGTTVVLLPTSHVFSDDGRYLLFASDGTTLVGGVSGLQLYRRDLQDSVTTLVSARTGTTATIGGTLDPQATAFSSSGDGRFVAFTALSANLAGIATDVATRQVFLRDLSTNVTTLVSVSAAGTAGANAAAGDPLISRNADIVAFSSAASNLVTGIAYPATPRVHAFARTLAAGTTGLLSLTPFGTIANGDTHVAGISASGRYVALSTRASDLTNAADSNLAVDLAVRDLATDTTTMLSTVPSGAITANAGATMPAWVNDRGQATFPSQSTDLVTGASGNLIYGFGVPQPVFTISGTIRRGGAPVPGVAVALSGGATATARTNLAGTFTFAGLAAGASYTVTPSLTGSLFTPPSQTIANLQSNVAADFDAVQPAIRGIVTLLGSGLAGVTLTLSGSAQAVTTTGGAGQFEFAGLPAGGSFTVVPALAGISFSPAFRTFAAVVSDQSADFAGSCAGTITGLVRDRLDAGVPGVTVTLAPVGLSTTTGNDGRFTFTGVPFGQVLVVAPSLAGYTFVPASQPVTPTACATEVGTPFLTSTGLFTRYLAEGATGPFFDTSIALLNATGTPTTVRATFQTRAGGFVSQDVALAGPGRATIDPEILAGLEDAEFSTVILSGQPVIADRTMRWDARGYGSHAETSIAQPLTTWYLAEGATIAGFNLFYLVQNPGDQEARITVTYLLPEPRPPITKSYTIGAGRRENIWVNTEAPGLAAAEVSAVVTSDRPVIVERAMYRDGAGQRFSAGHASAGVAAPSTTWFFAEGATGDYFDLFFLLANPATSAASVEARYLLPDGTVVTKVYEVAAQSRFNVWVDLERFEGVDGLPLKDTAVSAVFTVTNGVPIVAERAMWWPGAPDRWFEGHNAAGAPATGTKWAMAEGEVGGRADVQTFILIANPSDTDALVEVKLVYEDGTTSASLLEVRAHSRANFDVARQVPTSRGRRFGAIVESLGGNAAPIVVERAMYSDADGVEWAAGTVSLATRLR